MNLQQENRKIVVVEDEVLVAADLASRLQRFGYQVVGKATSGEEALLLAGRERPDLVMMDIVLKGDMDGIETAEIIRNKWGIPVVFVTAYADDSRLERAKLSHPFGYILKPFRDRELKVTIEMALYVSKLDSERKITEERYRNLFTSTNDGICLHEMVFEDGKAIDYRIMDINPKYESITGIHREDAIGALASDLYGIGEPPFLDIFAKVAETGEPVSFETYIEPLGKHFYLSVYSPGPHQFGTVFKDISTRKRAEEALARSEKRYRLLAENTFDVIFMTDENIHMTYYSPSVERMLGYTPEEMLDLPLESYISPESLDLVREQVRQRLESERNERGGDDSRTWILEYIRKDGNRIWVELITTPMRGQDGRFQGLVGVTREVTEKVEAEKALRMSEEKYRLLFETSETLISVYDARGICLMMNEKVADFFGGSPEQFIGKSFTDLHPEAAGVYAARIAEVIDYGTIGTYEDLVEFPEGCRWLLSSVHPVRDAQGAIYAAQIMSQDITQLKRAEEERELLEGQLHQARKMEAVGTLAGGVAHDFNNLLQAINGFTQLILMDKTETDPDYGNLKSVERASDRAAGLIRQLLLFSRKVDSDRRPVELNHEVEHAGRMLERTIPKMVDIEVHLSGRLWTIDADPIQMEQIILNLGQNAADAMPEGGTLTIETENITLHDDYAQTHFEAAPGNYVLMTVSDTGHGMDAETLEHIFEPFYTTKEIGKGTGLGLASVYGVVKNHGGHIMCYSEVGQGTVFKIYFPAIEGEDDQFQKDVSQASPQGGTETILLVDDESYIREFAEQILGKYGYTILSASSGEEALEKYSASKDKIDMVILDIGMPGMGGHNCLIELLKHDPAVKVLIASGYSANGPVRGTLNAGAVGYVGKPYQVRDLISKIRKVLDES